MANGGTELSTMVKADTTIGDNSKAAVSASVREELVDSNSDTLSPIDGFIPFPEELVDSFKVKLANHPVMVEIF